MEENLMNQETLKAAEDVVIESAKKFKFDPLTAGAVVVTGGVGYAAWRFAIKPGYKWLKGKHDERKANKAVKEEAEEVNEVFEEE